MESKFNFVNPELYSYVRDKIWPIYEKNDCAHNLSHVDTVLSRAFELNSSLSLHFDEDEIFVAVSYHDVCCHVDREKHEILSADFFQNDTLVHRFFAPNRISVIYEAIRDHRASSSKTPSNELGKLLSSADRTFEVAQILRRQWDFLFVPGSSSLDIMIEEAFRHCKNKFGIGGYATKKAFFDDGKYEKFLADMAELTSDFNSFQKMFLDVNSENISREFGRNNLRISSKHID